MVAADPPSMIFGALLGKCLTYVNDTSVYGPCMSGVPGSIGYIEYYLERALLARLEATKTTRKEVKDELLRIAVAFEALAMPKKPPDL